MRKQIIIVGIVVLVLAVVGLSGCFDNNGNGDNDDGGNGGNGDNEVTHDLVGDEIKFVGKWSLIDSLLDGEDFEVNGDYTYEFFINRSFIINQSGDVNHCYPWKVNNGELELHCDEYEISYEYQFSDNDNKFTLNYILNYRGEEMLSTQIFSKSS